VNDIVNKHNGTMSIESSEGEYTKVKICLPVIDVEN
jgi:signal transduction histidine kinase